jgi:hypothetical protein
VGVVYKLAMWDYFDVSRTEAPVEARGLKGSITNFIVPTDGATVQIRPQVHISERLSALGLVCHGFVLCKKSASVDLKGVSVIYKLSFASSIKRCMTILIYQEQKLTVYK